MASCCWTLHWLDITLAGSTGAGIFACCMPNPRLSYSLQCSIQQLENLILLMIIRPVHCTCTVRYAFYCAYRTAPFVNYGVIANLEDRTCHNYSNLLNNMVPSWHCQCRNGLRKASPKPPIFRLQHAPLTCWRHTRLAWKLKVGRNTLLLVNNSCFIHKKLFWAENGAKRPIYSHYCTARWHRLAWSDTVILANRNLDRNARGDHDQP